MYNYESKTEFNETRTFLSKLKGLRMNFRARTLSEPVIAALPSRPACPAGY